NPTSLNLSRWRSHNRTGREKLSAVHGGTMKHVAFMLALLVLGAAQAAEQISFPGGKGQGYTSANEVSATLQLPDGASGKLPAVVILHSAAGLDGRGAFHATALNQAGF